MHDQQSGSLDKRTIAAMMAAGEHRTYKPLEGSEEAQSFLVTVRDLSTPERVVIKDRGMRNLTAWWVHFQEDVFLGVAEDETFRFPVLRQSPRFYSVTFSDPTHRRFEVSVCPIFTEGGLVDGKDVVRVHIVPPARPASVDEKLKDRFFPADIVNIKMCDQHFGKGHGNALSLSAELKGETEKLFVRMPENTPEIIRVPLHWNIAFASAASAEHACGDKTIPQILGKLWFMCDTVAAPATYTLVQLTPISYVGCVCDVAGFNLFFQVNCSMTLADVQHFLPEAQTHSTLSDRRLTASPSAAPRVLHPAHNPPTRLLAQEAALVGLIFLRTLPTIQAMGSSSDKTTLPLWQRVGGYLSARMNALFQTMGAMRTHRNIADIKLVLDTAKREMQEASEQPVASLRMGQILDAMLNVRYLLMLSCIKSIPHSELRPTVSRLLDAIDVNGTGVDVKNSPGASEFLQVLANKSARDLLDAGANTFVPALFHTYDDFFAFLSTLPWGLPREIKKRVIGSDGTINAANERWKADNADPVRMKAGKRGDPPVSRDEFAAWLVKRYLKNDYEITGKTSKTARRMLRRNLVK